MQNVVVHKFLYKLRRANDSRFRNIPPDIITSILPYIEIFVWSESLEPRTIFEKRFDEHTKLNLVTSGIDNFFLYNPNRAQPAIRIEKDATTNTYHTSNVTDYYSFIAKTLHLTCRFEYYIRNRLNGERWLLVSTHNRIVVIDFRTIDGIDIAHRVVVVDLFNLQQACTHHGILYILGYSTRGLHIVRIDLQDNISHYVQLTTANLYVLSCIETDDKIYVHLRHGPGAQEKIVIDIAGDMYIISREIIETGYSIEIISGTYNFKMVDDDLVISAYHEGALIPIKTIFGVGEYTSYRPILYPDGTVAIYFSSQTTYRIDVIN